MSFAFFMHQHDKKTYLCVTCMEQSPRHRENLLFRHAGEYCHGWQVVEQCICPWMDGSTIARMESVESSREQRPRTMQEQLSRSNCRGAIAEAQRKSFISSCRRILPWMAGSRTMQEQLSRPVSIYQAGMSYQEKCQYERWIPARSMPA